MTNYQKKPIHQTLEPHPRRRHETSTLGKRRHLSHKLRMHRQKLFQYVVQHQVEQPTDYTVFNYRKATRDVGDFGTTLLHVAVGGGNIQNVKHLITQWRDSI